MFQRSERHHEVPVWLQREFSPDAAGKTVWLGVKASREIKPVGIRVAFRRKNANTRTDYLPGSEGRVVPKKSDLDEKLLAKFDSVAAPAARGLIEFARERLRHGSDAPPPSPRDVQICKELILAQFRRTRESQDEIGVGDDKSDLYLDLFYQRADECGEELPPRKELVADPQVLGLLADLSQNHRATFASANHSILANKERDFLASLGLCIFVTDTALSEFVIGSHGVSNLETPGGSDTWLPLAPDVAIAFSNTPGFISIAECTAAGVEAHNHAALMSSAFVAGRSKEVIERLFTSLD